MFRVFIAMLAVLFGVAERSAPAAENANISCVVVSEATYADPAWRGVADALVKKYGGHLIRYEGAVLASLSDLRGLLPDFVAFVARPEEAGRATVTQVHRMMRDLDDDPYTDALWGIVTGYEAADAARIVSRSAPLVLRRGMSSMGPGLLDRTDGGFCSSETEPGALWRKEDGAVVKESGGKDVARVLAAAFESTPVDYMVTSGHATERDWQIGYTAANGEIRSRAGNLYTLGLDGGRHPFSAPASKVYMAAGNCLIGHVTDREALALAWIHGGGVDQMVGYTVVTFFGYGGWGTSQLFDRGHHTLSEAFFLNTQSLLHRLHEAFPRGLDLEVESFEPEAIGRWAGREGLDREQAGMVWDRDTVAFYGDPAWQARWPQPTTPWTQTLEWGDGAGRFVIETTAAGKWPDRPVMALLPERITDITVTAGAEHKPLVTDNFLLVPVAGDHAAGERIEIAFRGSPLRRPPAPAASAGP